MSNKKLVPTERSKSQATMLSGVIQQLKLVWALFQDKRVSLMTKSVIPLSLLYLISPVDFVPDAILGLGQLDDFGIILLGMSLFVKLCPPEIVEYYRHTLEYGTDPHEDDDETVDTTYRVIDEED